LSEIVAGLPESPYKGLLPYTERDAAFFFGREVDREIVAANLRGTRLTLLYGASGVGKSSLLQAGLVHHLRALARTNLQEHETPELAVAYFNSWRGDPLPGLLGAVEDAVRDAWGGREVAAVPENLRLAEALRAWTERLDGVLLILLDQFEDYFLYHPERGNADFDTELAWAVNAPDLRVGFLICVREEALAHLDRFKGKIRGLFMNYLRLERLDWSGARKAIEMPLKEWSSRIGLQGDQAYRAETDLVEEVLGQIPVGRLALGVGELPPTTVKAAGDRRIETLYLQLVLSRLWEEEKRLGSRVLRKATLVKTLGGVATLIQAHVDNTLAGLSSKEQRIAAKALRQLVTPTGQKNVLAAEDLAGYTKLDIGRIEAVLHTLSRSELRVLRSTTDQQGVARYEIFHEVLAPAVLAWLQRFEEERNNRSFGLVVIIVVLAVAGWIYLPRTIGENEKDLHNPSALPKNLAEEIAQLKLERSTLQQDLERLQAMAATERRGIVLSHLSNIKNELQREAQAYQHTTPAGYDLRNYSRAYAEGRLRRLGPAPRGSAASYEREALEFLLGFVDANIPPQSTDLTVLDRLLDAYDDSERSPAR